MRAREPKTGHVIYNPAYTYKFQLKTTKETSQKMEKMAVCVKPFHLNYNRALWVSFRPNNEIGALCR